VFAVSFPTAVDRFITLWEMAGELSADPVINEAQEALRAGAPIPSTIDAAAIFEAHKDLLSLHELIAHRIFQILIGAHRGRTYSV
jgi:xylose isomerase